MRITIIISVILLSGCKGQGVETKLACGFHSGSEQISNYSYDKTISFETNNTAIKIIDEILQVSGLERNFNVIEDGGVENAAAVVVNEERYIIYNKDFFNKVQKITNSKWAAISILAHEIGHHLQGHTIQEGGSRPRIELEADKFSGFVLNLMGASLGESQIAIRKLASNEETKTHPSKSVRLQSIEEGYNNAAKRIDGKVNILENRKAFEYEYVLTSDLLRNFIPNVLKYPSKHFSKVLLEVGSKLIRIENPETLNLGNYNQDREYLRLEEQKEIKYEGNRYNLISTNILPHPTDDSNGKVYWARAVQGVGGLAIYENGNLIASNFEISNGKKMGVNPINLKTSKILYKDEEIFVLQTGNSQFIAMKEQSNLIGINIPKFITDGAGYIDDPVVIKRENVLIKNHKIIAEYIDLRNSQKIWVTYTLRKSTHSFEPDEDIYSFR